ncbi:hypothetical protein D3C77_591900 [compost metagenome]
MDSDNNQINVGKMLYIDGGNLKLDFSNYKMDSSTAITLITAKGIKGKFASVTADGYDVSVTYKGDSVIAHVVAK